MTRQERRARTALADSARLKFHNALRRGEIIKPDRCNKCGGVFHGPDLHGHHFDYEKPLEVVWLCGPCHRKTHKLISWIDLCSEWLQYCRDSNLNPNDSSKPHINSATKLPTTKTKYEHWRAYIYRAHASLPNNKIMDRKQLLEKMLKRGRCVSDEQLQESVREAFRDNGVEIGIDLELKIQTIKLEGAGFEVVSADYA